jgi:hypothetical protein
MPKPRFLEHRVPKSGFCSKVDGCGFQTPNRWDARCASCRRKIDYQTMQEDILLGLTNPSTMNQTQLEWMKFVLSNGADNDRKRTDDRRRKARAAAQAAHIKELETLRRHWSA